MAVRSVVIVDDDVELASAVAEVLSEEGYQAIAFHAGDAALAHIRRNPPALILLDVRLPDVDGFSIAEALANDRHTQNVPVLFVSGERDLAHRMRDVSDHDADFLRKPFRADDLVARVEQALARSQRDRMLRSTARTDDLTGLGNFRLFEERLAIEAARIERYGTSLSVVVLDVDGLKRVNDHHGHATGSELLRTIGHCLAEEIRDTDVAARYGGDEFVVLLPHTTASEALVFAERLIEHLRLLRPAGLPVSVSMGVATFDPEEDQTARHVFERADAGAYDAKRLGGNRICTGDNI